MEGAELSGRRAPTSEGIEHLQALPIEDHHFCLAPVADIEETLFGIRRKCGACGGCAVSAFRGFALAADKDLADVFPIKRKHLDSLSTAVRDIDGPILRNARGVHGLNELWSTFFVGVRK